MFLWKMKAFFPVAGNIAYSMVRCLIDEELPVHAVKYKGV
jgi:hypothetical protein